MQILPGVLARGEAARSERPRACSRRSSLGYDVGARLGRGDEDAAARAPERPGGAAGRCRRAERACAGWMPPTTSRAMRIAATLVLTPSYNNAVGGATALNVAGGMSGFAARLAPELALAGIHRPGRCDRGSARATWSATASIPPACWRSSARAGRSRATGCACGRAAIRSTPRSTRSRKHSAALTPKAEEHRADRRRDVSLRLGDAPSRSAELLRVEILAAACGGVRWW